MAVEHGKVSLARRGLAVLEVDFALYSPMRSVCPPRSAVYVQSKSTRNDLLQYEYRYRWQGAGSFWAFSHANIETKQNPQRSSYRHGEFDSDDEMITLILNASDDDHDFDTG